jgi:D-glycero-D-manno-heptose 1,7-bisphosphate phosphatase
MPAVVLDLDGTVRYSKNGEFINSPEDVALFPDVEEKLWEFRNTGYLIFGVSNQGGVAFGYKTHKSVWKELVVTCGLFQESPFHFLCASECHEDGTVEPFCHRSFLRKPEIGMLAAAEADAWSYGYIVDWDRSFFVGDRPEDEECAQRAGIAFVHADVFFERSK